MNASEILARFWNVTKHFAQTEPLFLVAVYGFVLIIVGELLLAPTLILMLNKRFDPRFKKELNGRFSLIPAPSLSYLRASFYAFAVTIPWFISRNDEKLKAYPFRSQIGKAALFFSWCHTILMGLFLLEFPTVLYLTYTGKL